MSLSPVKPPAPRQRGSGGVASQVMPAASSPDNKDMWTQLAKWYLGPGKEGGNDPSYLAYPMKRIKTPLKCCQLRMTDDILVHLQD